MVYPKLQSNILFCCQMDQCDSARFRTALILQSVLWVNGCGRIPPATNDARVNVTSPSVWQIAHIEPVTVADKMGCMQSLLRLETSRN
jgi:hypothetical protein